MPSHPWRDLPGALHVIFGKFRVIPDTVVEGFGVKLRVRFRSPMSILHLCLFIFTLVSVFGSAPGGFSPARLFPLPIRPARPFPLPNICCVSCMRAGSKHLHSLVNGGALLPVATAGATRRSEGARRVQRSIRRLPSHPWRDLPRMWRFACYVMLRRLSERTPNRYKLPVD